MLKHTAYGLRRPQWNRLIVMAFVVSAIFLIGLPSLQHDMNPFSALRFSSSTSKLWNELEARLVEWSESPILSATEMNGLGEPMCPKALGGRNSADHHHQEAHYWAGFSDDDVRRARTDLVNWLRAARERGQTVIWPQRKGSAKKRGMIMTGGNGHTMKRIALVIDLIRNVYQSQIPIEIFSFDDEEVGEEGRLMAEKFGGITFRTITGSQTGQKRHYIKGRAFLENSFDEFLYMDSDNIPLQPPSQYFDSVEYISQGSIFWPDMYKDHAENAIWRIIGEPCSGDWAQETGQVLFDRTGNSGWNQAVLILGDRMQTEGDFWYHFSMGDKDTWRYAYKILGLPVPYSGRSFSPLGAYTNRYGSEQNDFCGHTMMQWGLTPPASRRDANYHPEPGFAHANMLKYHNDNSNGRELLSHFQRPALDELTELSLERVKYNFNWGQRCLRIEDRPAGDWQAGDQKAETIRFEDAFIPGREEDIIAIRQVARELLRLGPEPLPA